MRILPSPRAQEEAWNFSEYEEIRIKYEGYDIMKKYGTSLFQFPEPHIVMENAKNLSQLHNQHTALGPCGKFERDVRFIDEKYF